MENSEVNDICQSDLKWFDMCSSQFTNKKCSKLFETKKIDLSSTACMDMEVINASTHVYGVLLLLVFFLRFFGTWYNISFEMNESDCK